jgi:phage shock protein C
MKKKLERDEEKKVVAGVISGMANYFNQDPVLFRIAAITFLVITGFFPGILLYIAAWVVMPKNDGRVKVDYEM